MYEMVALLSQIISSFRCIISSIIPWLSLRSDYSTVTKSLVHHWNIPFPDIIHRELTEEFVNQFDEVLVIGDVHGCYDELMLLLAKINNNQSDYNKELIVENTDDSNNNLNNNKILKLFAGDIVNKGPKSKEVLQFMINNRNSCLSVRGNHDEMVIREYLRFEKDGELSLSDKNKWIKELTRNQIDYLVSMSYTIRIPSLNLMVVHAGLVPGVPLQSQHFENMVNMRNLITCDSDNKQSGNQYKATESDKEGEPWADKWLGPEHIYFGHDARRKLQLNRFTTGLDTGCVYGNHLTSVFVSGQRKGTFFTVKANKVHSQPKEPVF
jgi:hypothetical protein